MKVTDHFIFVGDTEGNVNMYDVGTGKFLRHMDGHEDEIKGIEV